jgi:hypothetical protein
MTLKSNLFRGSRGLAACEINDSAHFTIGKQGDDVGRIQMALFAIDSLKINRQELLSKIYGQSTAAAVLAFKTKRKIINYAYQKTPDNIVGKMTIAALDREMSVWEATHRGDGGDCIPAIRAARSGFRPQVDFALASSTGTAPQPQPQIRKHTLRIYCSITKKASIENGYPLGQAVQLARDCLSNHGMFLSLEFSSFGFADTIDFDDDQVFLDDQTALLRQASETQRPGFPNILRVIACRMGRNGNYGENFRNRSIGGITFLPFVFLNTQNVDLDGNTLIHEMIHAALPADRAKQHDPENFSVFFGFGRSEQGAPSQTVLKPERAADLSNAFFAI